MISVKNLTKQYKKSQKKAVDDISFSVNKGEYFTLLGPNGAGKTTTISILTTTLAKTSGEIYMAGFDLDQNPSQVRKSIGVIFQNPSLDRNLSAEENVRFHAFLYGLYQFKPSFKLMPKIYQDQVMQLAELLDIKDSMFKPIHTFSGGMKRKLEIVRSLMHNPKILFLDEPTSGLDPVSRKNLWQYIRQIREKENTTIFLTTHYLEEAEESDTVCIINEGKIISLGTPKEIKNKLTQSYMKISTEHKNKLIKELKKLNYDYIDEGDITINFSSEAEIHQILRSIETPLSNINIHNPTLEEAYLNLIDESGKNI